MARRTPAGRRLGIGRMAVLGGFALLAAACGGGDDDDSADTTTTEEETTTTEGSTTTTAAEGGTSDAWRAIASEFRAEGGEHEFECPAGGAPYTIWGVETYSDDSSVCTAAVHVGLITLEEGGTVTIEMAPGLDWYPAGVANGVTSISYPPYQGSFTFPEAPPGTGDFEPSPASWTETAANLEVGDSRTIDCSPNGTVSGIWGTGTYTADSRICTAGVHEGVITVEDGGEVTVKATEGQDSYEGSTANGITSQDYPAYSKSFEVTS